MQSNKDANIYRILLLVIFLLILAVIIPKLIEFRTYLQNADLISIIKQYQDGIQKLNETLK